MKPIQKALAETLLAYGIELVRAELESKDGTVMMLRLVDSEMPAGSPWTFTNNSARYRGTEFPVTGKKLTILAALAKAAGEPVAKADLFHAAWGDEPPDELNFHSTIYQLRKLLMKELRPDRDPIENEVGAFVLTLN